MPAVGVNSLNLFGPSIGDLTECLATFVQNVSGTTTLTIASKYARVVGGYTLRSRITVGGGSEYARASFGLFGADMVQVASNKAAYACSVYVTFDAWPSANSDTFMALENSAGSGRIILAVSSTGKIVARNSYGGTTRFTGTTTLTLGTTFRISVITDGSGGTVYVDGAQEGTSAFLGSADTGKCWLGGEENQNGLDVYFSDLIIVDAASDPGEGTTYFKSAAGNSALNTGWTSSDADAKWQNLNILPPLESNGYITSSSSADAYTATLSALNIATINTVKQLQVVRDEGGSSALKERYSDGASNADNSTNADPGASYVMLGRMLDTMPLDSSAWSKAKLDTAEVGPLNGAAVAVRCICVGLAVYGVLSVAPARRRGASIMTG